MAKGYISGIGIGGAGGAAIPVVPPTSPFADEEARDVWAAANLTELLNNKDQFTVIQLLTGDAQRWTGENQPAVYDSNGWVTYATEVGVLTVSGNAVDNTDPQNPTVDHTTSAEAPDDSAFGGPTIKDSLNAANLALSSLPDPVTDVARNTANITITKDSGATNNVPVSDFSRVLTVTGASPSLPGGGIESAIVDISGASGTIDIDSAQNLLNDQPFAFDNTQGSNEITLTETDANRGFLGGGDYTVKPGEFAAFIANQEPSGSGTFIYRKTAGFNKWAEQAVNDTTGYGVYIDSSTSLLPQTFSNGVTQVLTNDKSSVPGESLPTGAASFYNSATNKFQPDQNGENVAITLEFNAKASGGEKSVVIEVEIPNGIAPGVPLPLNRRTARLAKAPNTEIVVGLSFTTPLTDNAVLNGIEVKLTFDDNVDVYGVVFTFSKLSAPLRFDVF